MPDRRQLRRAIPRPLRQRLYDWSPSRRRRWRETPGITRVPADAGVVLTFDDGPDEACTPELLDALDGVGATATFFVIGERVAENPALALDVKARGHELALHGMTHRRHDLLTAEEASTELSQGMEAIESAAGCRPRWYRPPFGASSPQLASICAELGLQLAYWDAWGQDWEGDSASRIARLVLRNLDAGSVILLHDSALYGQRDDAKPTVESIPIIARSVHEKGLEMVSLGTALNGNTG
jgi:peptidoglycan/xylan/chitin deacetylase (PgdA/CDA1 family)